MPLSGLITGQQHLGLPTRDLQATQSFYESLGFHLAYASPDGQVLFLRLHDVVIETYLVKETADKPGALDHLALDVTDIDAAFAQAKQDGYAVREDKVQFLPFWAHGVKFFNLTGPNGETVELSQML